MSPLEAALLMGAACALGVFIGNIIAEPPHYVTDLVSSFFAFLGGSLTAYFIRRRRLART
jgi:hypothetical protein